MHLSIEGVEYVFPATLKEVTLGDRIAYDQQYGQELAEKLHGIAEMEEGIEKDLCYAEYYADLACKTVSFFGKVPLDIIQNTRIDDVFFVYQQGLNELIKEIDFNDEAFQLQNEFEWNGSLWTIPGTTLDNTSNYSFGAFLDSKQSIKNAVDFGSGNWEALLLLACVNFRMKDEPYKESMSAEGGERYQLLQTLPMDIALHVGFFFLDFQNSYMKTFHSSGQAMEKAEAGS